MNTNVLCSLASIPLQRMTGALLVAMCGTTAGAIHIEDIHPTVFFRATDVGLQQRVEVTVHAESACEEVILRATFGDRLSTHSFGAVPAGEHVRDILVPDVREALPVTFALQADGQAAELHSRTWEPMRQWKIDMVHGSHHDLGYTDLPSNILHEHARNLDRVLDFCDETDDWPEASQFHYVVEQAWSILYYVRTQPPGQIERLKRRVQEGRIEITALMGNETTELCGHEEQIRLLYPAFSLKRRFNTPITTAELNDIPGVSWGMASVLSGSGVRYFTPGIPDYYSWGKRVHAWWDEREVLPRDVPGAFWWEGPDGSRLLYWHTGGRIDAPRVRDYDQTERDLPRHLARLSGAGYRFDRLRAKYHGQRRDNAPPNLQLSRMVREWNEQWAYPKLRVTTNHRFFTDFEREFGASLKVVRGDLPNTDYTTGAACSARETGINRLAHDALTRAETFATWASLLGVNSYPADTLRDGYEAALLFDEHTWGMAHPVGPAQDACWAEKSLYAWRAAGLAHDVAARSTRSIAENVRLSDDGYHVVVFNPSAHSRTGVVRMPAATFTPASANPTRTVRLPDGLLDRPFEVVDITAGRVVPHQVVELNGPEDAVPWAAERWALSRVSQRRAGVLDGDRCQRQDLVFVATDLPPLGYATYRIVPRDPPGPTPTALKVTANALENEFYRITLDSDTGTIVSLWDKALQREWVDPGAAYGLNQVVVREPGVDRVTPAGHSTVAIGHQGPVLASLVVTGDAVGCPRRTQEITLYAGQRQIDLATRLLKDGLANLEYYVAFPFHIEGPRFAFEAPNSVIRPIEDQMPGSNTGTYAIQHWLDVSNPQGGVTVSSLEAPLVKLSALWPGSVSQAHHGVRPKDFGQAFLRDSAQFNTGHVYSYALASNFRTNFKPTQSGEVLFRYSLLPHDGVLVREDARRFGDTVANPLLPAQTQGPGDGALAARAAFCEVGPATVTVRTIKRAEDGDGVIIRLAETAGEDVVATVRFPAYEITDARSVNLVEEDLDILPHDLRSLPASIRANGLATIRCRLQSIRKP